MQTEVGPLQYITSLIHTRSNDSSRTRRCFMSSGPTMTLFFELMPCALEAQTVIKTFCLRLAIPTFWRIGESKKLGVFKTTQTQKQQNNQTKTKPTQPKKTPRKLRETLRFQKVPKPLSTASRCHSKSHI